MVAALARSARRDSTKRDLDSRPARRVVYVSKVEATKVEATKVEATKVEALMSSARFPIPQGTLDMLILQMLSLEAAHGYGIAQRLQQISRDTVQVNQGSLYPALHRLEQKRWLTAEWRQSDTGREAKFYALTRAGQQAAGARKGQLEPVDVGCPADLQRGSVGRDQAPQSASVGGAIGWNGTSIANCGITSTAASTT